MAVVGKASPRTDGIIGRVAEKVGCEPAVIDAILHVETQEMAFDPSGRLIIRPEAHKLAGCPFLNDADRKKAAKLGLTIQPKLVGYQYDPIKAGNTAWAWVDKVAFEFGEEAAFWATSFGSPQIMGFNFTLCKYASPGAMVRAFADEEDVQLLAMANFIVGTGLKEACRQRKWKAIARAYNGVAYAKNAYDQKLEKAYEDSGEHKSTDFIWPEDDVLEMGENGAEVKALQNRLTELGFHLHADGDFGSETRDAVRALQFRMGVAVDGKVGPETRRVLAVAPAKEPPATTLGAVVAASTTAKASIAQIVLGTVATGTAVAQAVGGTSPPPLPPPNLTDIEGAVKLGEQGLGLGQKILAIGVDKMLIAIAIGAMIFGAITLTRRIQAHYARKVG